MKKCWWCWKPETYAFGVCHTCYRWFYRHPYLDNTNYCTLCNKFITKRNKGGMCTECNKIIKAAGSTPKRLENLEEKFKELKPFFDGFSNKEQAFKLLSESFGPKQIKCLEALLERYFEQVTLQTVADSWGVSREYVRQCENKAIVILKEKFYDV